MALAVRVGRPPLPLLKRISPGTAHPWVSGQMSRRRRFCQLRQAGRWATGSAMYEVFERGGVGGGDVAEALGWLERGVLA